MEKIPMTPLGYQSLEEEQKKLKQKQELFDKLNQSQKF